VTQRTPDDAAADKAQRAAKRPAGAGRKRSGRSPRAARPAGVPVRPRLSRSRRGSGPRPLTLARSPFRLWSAFCIVAFVISLFAARLIQLQGVDASNYAALALKADAATVILEAPRADIYDRNGVPLAQSVDSSRLVADPTYTTPYATQIAAALHHRLGVDYIAALDLLRKPDTRYVLLARHIEPSRAAAFVNYLDRQGWAGVYADKDTTRVYASHDVAANLVGFVGDSNQGLDGFEASLNTLLRGRDGKATFQMSDGQQLPLAASTVQQPKEGTGVRLTIDQSLQFLAQRRLGQAVQSSGAMSGSAVVMDVRTGQILALADYPTFDPNSFADYPQSSYGAPSLQDPYEPGSVEKVLTFSALIDSGYVTPHSRVTVPPVLPVPGGHIIHDYFVHPTLRLTDAGVIAKSSNIGTVLSSEKIPNATLYRYLRSFGLGSPTGVGLAGESPGLLPAPRTWTPLVHDTITFGQGLSVTAVQMTAAISAIANGGVYVKPSLIESYVDSAGKVTPPKAPQTHRVIRASTARKVARMMELVVGPEGTAPGAAIPGYAVAGKTGTAQRVGGKCNCYKTGGFTVSFGGFAPADNPRFAVYVVVQHPRNGGGGGSIGGPVFHDLMTRTLQEFGVPPTGVHQPALPVFW
jgi:cell division protein FtsI (penicillin-binding protein 3)